MLLIWLFVLLTMPSVYSAMSNNARSANRFSDSARFERWSHFKDYGIPGTVHDHLNQAAIADGSCRLLDPPIALDGYALWWEPSRVSNVLAALAAAPATDRPSYFVRATSEALMIPCSKPTHYSPANFSLAARSAGLQNWYHALCAPETDESWKGEYDPAEEPQQIALTAGFACIVACEANQRDLKAEAMARLSAQPAAAHDAICTAFPWTQSYDFTKATTVAQLATLTSPMLRQPCGC